MAVPLSTTTTGVEGLRGTIIGAQEWLHSCVVSDPLSALPLSLALGEWWPEGSHSYHTKQCC